MKIVPGKDRYDLPADFEQVARISWRTNSALGRNVLPLLLAVDFFKLEKGEGAPVCATVLPPSTASALDKSTLAFWPTPDKEYEIELIYMPQWKQG